MFTKHKRYKDCFPRSTLFYVEVEAPGPAPADSVLDELRGIAREIDQERCPLFSFISRSLCVVVLVCVHV
jgi:hypothetical protein